MMRVDASTGNSSATVLHAVEGDATMTKQEQGATRTGRHEAAAAARGNRTRHRSAVEPSLNHLPLVPSPTHLLLPAQPAPSPPHSTPHPRPPARRSAHRRYCIESTLPIAHSTPAAS